MTPEAYLLACGWHPLHGFWTHPRLGSHTLERAVEIQVAERRAVLAFELGFRDVREMPPPVSPGESPPSEVPLVLGVAGEVDDEPPAPASTAPAPPPVVVRSPAPSPSRPTPPPARPRPTTPIGCLPAVVVNRPGPPLSTWLPTARQRKLAASILPMLPGPGERRDDCAHYEDRCLKRLAIADLPGHCPADCAELQVFDRKTYVSYEGARRPGAENGTGRRKVTRAKAKAA